MSNLASNLNAKTSTLNIAADLRENINCIKKFGLLLSVTQYINFQFILNDAHIDNPTIVSNIELNFYVFHYLESYQLSQSLFVNYMLKIFCEKFYG